MARGRDFLVLTKRSAASGDENDGGHTKKFVACNVAVVGRDSTAAILHAIGVDTRCTSAIARNIAPCIQALRRNQPSINQNGEREIGESEINISRS